MGLPRTELIAGEFRYIKLRTKKPNLNIIRPSLHYTSSRMIDTPNVQEIEGAKESRDTSKFLAPKQDEVQCHNACCQPHCFIQYLLVPFFLCSLSFGVYFCYDNFAALEGRVKSDLNITITEFAVMNSMCAWPNIFLSFVGGYLIDRVFGVRLGTNIYAAVTLSGQLMVASGAILNMYWLVLCGRLVFGIGAVSLEVGQNNYAVHWFNGKELNIVFGLQLSFGGIGSVVNFMVMEPTYRWLNQFYDGHRCLGLVLLIAASPCLLATLCSLILGSLDNRAERIRDRNETRTVVVVSLKDMKDFRLVFWLVCIIDVMYYATVYPFIGLATGFFKEKFHFDDMAASRFGGLMYMVSVLASPALGYLIDLTGKKTVWILIGTLGSVIAHALLAFTNFAPYIGMALMGICYSILASSLFPLVSLIIPKHQLGTGYGVCKAVENLGLALTFIITGRIVHQFGYRWAQIFFITCLFVAHVTTLFLWVVDKNTGSVLNLTSRERKIQQENLNISQNMQRENLLQAM